MKYCPNCGSEVNEGSAFCTSCGSPLAQSEPVNQDNTGDSVFGFDEQPLDNQQTYYNNQPINQQSQENNQPQKTNSMCVVGFVLSFFFSLIGMIVSCVGLSQVKKNPNEKGKGLAVAGIIIGILGTIVSFIVSYFRFKTLMGQI